MENKIISSFEAIHIETNHPLAFSSADHMHPKGTRFDLSVNPRFSYKSKLLFKNVCPQIRALDLGCSGGSYVNEWVQTGHFGVGVEGSDYSRNYQRGAWPIISKFLFTADITEDFSLSLSQKEEKEALDFHLITAWEVMEHLDEQGLIKLVKNIKKHLAQEGIFVCSISPRASDGDDIELHQTVQNEQWWEEFLKKQGLVRNRDIEHFYNHQYVRGGRIDDFDSFNFVLHSENWNGFKIPNLGKGHRLLDRWFHSKLHRSVRSILSV